MAVEATKSRNTVKKNTHTLLLFNPLQDGHEKPRGPQLALI